LRWHGIGQEAIDALLKAFPGVIGSVPAVGIQCRGSRIPLDANHHGGQQLFEALFLLGRIVHHLVQLTHVVEKNHDESEAAGGRIVFSFDIAVSLESRPKFKDELVEFQSAFDLAGPVVIVIVMQCLEMSCQG